MELSVHSDIRKYDFETAIEHTGFGKYNISMLATCCCLIVAMYVEIFGLSVLMPSVACDMSLTTSQQGILSAVPLIGVLISSYCWGLAADTIGRRKTLLIAMPTGFLLSTVASLAPSYATLTAFKLLSAIFTSAAHAAAFVLMAESMPNKNRCHFIFIMSSAIMFAICVVSVCALPIFQLNIRWPISWLRIIYRPWRLVLQVICFPGVFGMLGLLFLEESPKFLLSCDRNEEVLIILQKIFQANTGFKKVAYKNAEDCDNVIKPFTFYAVMCFSAIPTCIMILLSFVVSCIGKKKTTLMVFSVSMTCGVILIFVKIPLLSIAMFFMFLYVGQILGIVNAYLIDLNPTHLRGMASCLSVVVTRGLAFISVQVIGSLLLDYCTPMLGGYIALGLSGLIMAFFLPPDSRTTQGVVNDDHKPNIESVAITNVAKY